MIPPLLNDFIGLQKDTALVGILGAIEAFKQTQIDEAATFNFTPYIGAALLFVAITIPLARFTDWLVARDRRRQSRALRRDRGSRDRARPRGRPQVVRQPRGPARHRSGGRRARGRLPDRRVRLGQVDAAPVRQPARADRRGPHRRGRPRHHRARRRRERGAEADRNRVPGLQPVPAHDRSRAMSRSGRARRSASRAREAEAEALELLGRFGLADRRGRVSRPAVGRPAAAGGDRARAGDAARSCCCSTR